MAEQLALLGARRHRAASRRHRRGAAQRRDLRRFRLPRPQPQIDRQGQRARQGQCRRRARPDLRRRPLRPADRHQGVESRCATACAKAPARVSPPCSGRARTAITRNTSTSISPQRHNGYRICQWDVREPPPPPPPKPPEASAPKSGGTRQSGRSPSRRSQQAAPAPAAACCRAAGHDGQIVRMMSVPLPRARPKPGKSTSSPKIEGRLPLSFQSFAVATGA